MEKKNITAETIARTIICTIALINSVLVMMGKPVLNIGDETIEQGLSIAFTLFTTLWGFWKNNSFTQEAIEADEFLDELRKGGLKG